MSPTIEEKSERFAVPAPANATPSKEVTIARFLVRSNPD